MLAILAGVTLAHAGYTDLRDRRIRNGTMLLAICSGLAWRLLFQGRTSLVEGLTGLVVGMIWWVPVFLVGLGAGDAKLAMAIGGLLGPAAALIGPALGFMLCVAALIPWILYRRQRRLPWRGVAVPMAPWIAAGTALAWAVPRL